MKMLYVWSSGRLGVLNIAFADNIHEARDLIRYANRDIPDYIIDSELNNRPRIYRHSVSFTVWSDITDIVDSE